MVLLKILVRSNIFRLKYFRSFWALSPTSVRRSQNSFRCRWAGSGTRRDCRTAYHDSILTRCGRAHWSRTPCLRPPAAAAVSSARQRKTSGPRTDAGCTCASWAAGRPSRSACGAPSWRPPGGNRTPVASACPSCHTCANTRATRPATSRNRRPRQQPQRWPPPTSPTRTAAVAGTISARPVVDRRPFRTVGRLPAIRRGRRRGSGDSSPACSACPGRTWPSTLTTAMSSTCTPCWWPWWSVWRTARTSGTVARPPACPARRTALPPAERRRCSGTGPVGVGVPCRTSRYTETKRTKIR